MPLSASQAARQAPDAGLLGRGHRLGRHPVGRGGAGLDLADHHDRRRGRGPGRAHPATARQLRSSTVQPWASYHSAACCSPLAPSARRRSAGDGDRSATVPAQRVALLLDLGGLADAVAEVVELGPAHVAAADDLDLGDDRGVDREGALDADAVADLAHGEGLAHTGALAADDDALEDLHALLVALDHPHVDLQRVAGAEVRDGLAASRTGLDGGGVDDVEAVHGACVLRVAARGARREPQVGSGATDHASRAPGDGQAGAPRRRPPAGPPRPGPAPRR